MLDVVYVAATLALFALVALIAKGVENLGPRPTPGLHEPQRGEAQE